MHEIRHAIRLLAKSPGFTAAAVLVLGLGIGANTAIFSVLEATLLRPLPFPKADRLVRVYEAYDEQDIRANTLNLSEITVQQWREQAGEVFTDFAAATGASVTLGATGGSPARSFNAARVTRNFLPVLGLPPLLGRNFTPGEDVPNGPRVAMVSYDFWQRELGGREDVLREPVIIDNAPHQIVGVMPRNFRHPYRAQVWLPLGAAFDPSQGRGHYLYGVARLRDGLSVPAANAAMLRICATINSAAPDSSNPRRAYIRELRDGFVADIKPKLLMLAAAAFCTFLVAAANFAGLLLARSVTRENDTAIRAALGASRRNLVRESLTQALVLSGIGTVVGLFLAAWFTPALVALSPEGSDATGSAMREFDHAVRLDLPVFAYAAGALLLSGVGFGFLPAWRASRTDVRTGLMSGGRSATLDRGTRRLLGALVIAEIAVAAVLLVAGGTMAQYFKHLLGEPWGIETGNRISFQTMMSDRVVPQASDRELRIEKALAELRAIPGVESATATLPHPLTSARQLIGMNVEGTPPPEPRGFHLGYLRAATPGYFATIGQPLLRGRDFTDDDRAGTNPVMIVNQSFASRFWPGEDPIGKRIKWGLMSSARPWFTVVGVVADTKIIADPNDGEVVGSLTIPMAQLLGFSSGFNEFTFVVHTADGAQAMDAPLRGALGRTDSRLAAYEMTSLDSLVGESRVTERFSLVLISLFGVLGLVLAAIGLYGLLALQVARRRKEFGVRSALGATSADIVRLVLSQGALLGAAGFVIGGAAAWAGFRIAMNQWPELPEPTMLPFFAAGMLLASAATLACSIPARNAARVDPMVALRSE